jgi:hypothetical protein
MNRYNSLFIVYDRILRNYQVNPENRENEKHLEEAQLAVIDTACMSLDPVIDDELWHHAYEVKALFHAYEKEPGAVRDGNNNWNKANLFATFSDECGVLFSSLRKPK